MSQLRNQRNLFFIMSFLLAFGAAFYVLTLHKQMKATLMTSFADDSQEYYRMYQGAYQFTLTSMTQAVTLIAHDEDIVQTFYQGAHAVTKEGGGAGGEQAQQYRKALLEQLESGWNHMTEDFSVRQLHFHLPPEDISFLRVHRPEKYGDDLSSVRHMIVDVHKDQIPRQGFELGRVYSGIRSVLPIFYDQDQQQQLIGSLEAGTSFNSILSPIKAITHVDAAILINMHDVDNAMWQTPMERAIATCQCYLEASTTPDKQTLEAIGQQLNTAHVTGHPEQNIITQLISSKGSKLIMTAFPIYDYVSLRDQKSTPTGWVVMWRSVQTELDELYHTTLLYGALGFVIFLIVELILAFGIRFTYKQLQAEIDARTKEMSNLNSQLKTLAYNDPLTGLLNRRALMDRFEKLFIQSNSQQQPLSLLMLDIDHFKHVNDKFGHQTGDQVLSSFAALIIKNSSQEDLVGRYGGEEFCMVLPNTSKEEAIRIAESIRSNVQQCSVEVGPTREEITCSIGVADNHQANSIDKMISCADANLYQAKNSGRNKVCWS